MEMKNFEKTRENGQRNYSADLIVNGEEFNFYIIEEYLTRGVEYKVKIKSKEETGLTKRFFKNPNLPNLTKEEWYHLYFHFSNKR